MFVLSLVTIGLLAVSLPLFRMLLGIEIGLYILALLTAGLLAAFQKQKTILIIGLPLSIAIMHICWGSGFLWSMIKGVFTKPLPEMKK